ncbi:MAG: MFS transporter [Acidobacteriaceae bacterium]|nr:MFS transporter [Acidobacteriaceae bacterium]
MLERAQTPSDVSTAAALSTGMARRWAIVALLCAAFIIAYIDRQNLSLALTDRDFNKFFRLSDNGRGLLNSAFFWSYAMLQIPAGWVVDRFGVKRPFAIFLALWSMFSGLTAWCSTATQLFGLRILLGAGEAINTPAGMRWIRLNFKEQQHGFIMGLYQASAKVGPAIGAPLVVWLLLFFGWRLMFIIVGFGALLWILPWLLLVHDDDRQLERAVLQRSDAPLVPFRTLFHSPVMWGIIIGSFCYNYFNYFCLTWLPAYFAESRHLSLNKTGWFTGVSFWGFAIVATSAGFFADRVIHRGDDAVRIRKAFIIAGFVLASSEMIGAVSSSASVALFFAIFSLSGLGLATGNIWALTPAVMPGAPPARLAAVQNMAANLPGIVAPILTGWLKQASGGYEAPMAVNLGFLLLGIASYLFLVRRKYAPQRAVALS